MSRIDDLIAEHAPAGVDYVALEKLFDTRNGYTPSKANASNWIDGLIPWFRMEDIRTNGRLLSEAARSVPGSAVKGGRLFQADSIIVATSATIGEHALITIPFLCNQRFTVLTLKPAFAAVLEMKFVFYYCFILDEWCRNNTSVSSFASVDMAGFKRFRFPIPPLEVQREIVRILDNFTELEAELETELEARRQQFVALTTNFAVSLRDRPGQGGQYNLVTLGSIAQEVVEPMKVQTGKSYVSLGVKWNGEGVLVREARFGDSIKATTLFRARPGQLMYNRMFVVEGSFALLPAGIEDAVVSSEFPLFKLDASRVEPEWLLQFLCNPHTLERIAGEVTGTERGSMKSRRRWKADQFREFKISLPTLEEQRKTIRALRSSDALISSLTDELAARRKQKTYYRDLLLTFEEAPA